MRLNNKFLFLLILIGLLLFACSSKQNEANTPIAVMFETDMGNDIDDALALDMLYKYMDEGRVNILAITLNKDYIHAPEYVDIMGTWYGYPDIPIGIYTGGENLSHDDNNYTTKVCALKDDEGKSLFERSLSDYNSLPKTHLLYRKILAEQPDNSVTVISVGFLTNLAILLDTSADEYSPLTGKELVARKVKLLSVMAGSFTEEPYVEYNVLINKPAATKVFAEWPSKIVVSPFEVGDSIKYPAASIENDFNWTDHHPMVEGYKAFSQMPYDRSTWDLTSVLYVAEPDSAFFGKSTWGSITSDAEGYTRFVEHADGKHCYLTSTPEQRVRVLDYFIRLITEKPKKYK